MKWAIRAQRVFDGTAGSVVRDAVVVIDGGRIAAVGPAAQVPWPTGCHVVDVGDRWYLSLALRDFINVVDGDLLTDISAMQRIHTVVKGGEMVVREGELRWSATGVASH